MYRPEMAVVITRLVQLILPVLLYPLRPRARIRALSLLMEELEPVWENPTQYGGIKFYCPATWPFSRSDMAKEPETLRWIDGFEPGDVLWDIGANVGVFSLYAAKRGLNVYSFEPAALNFAVLMKNIELNAFDEQITFLNVAIAENTSLSTLYMSHTKVGGAQHQFGRPQDETTDIKRDTYGTENAFRQSMLGFSIDDLIEKWGLPVPNHIKIDVDGNECEIVRGAIHTLAKTRLKSVLIEIWPDERKDEIRGILKNVGLELDSQTGMNHIFARGQNT